MQYAFEVEGSYISLKDIESSSPFDMLVLGAVLASVNEDIKVKLSDDNMPGIVLYSLIDSPENLEVDEGILESISKLTKALTLECLDHINTVYETSLKPALQTYKGRLNQELTEVLDEVNNSTPVELSDSEDTRDEIKVELLEDQAN